MREEISKRLPGGRAGAIDTRTAKQLRWVQSRHLPRKPIHFVANLDDGASTYSPARVEKRHCGNIRVLAPANAHGIVQC